MKHIWKFFMLLALTNSLCVQVFSQFEKAESRINDIIKELQVVGLSVAVVKHNKIIYTHSFGKKNIEKNELLKDSDIFRIASISKSFSATSIMQLVEKGKLSLSDDFGKLVGFPVRNPKFPDQVITLKMAMSHTSSINDSQGYLNLDVINPAKNPTWDSCYSDYPPGSKYNYCNLNYNMIGTIIEKISGERFDGYVKQHVIDPLALYAGYNVSLLDSTRFTTLYEYDSTTRNFIPSPAAYNPRREQIQNYILGYTTPVFSPTGGMKISATDLAKYMMMHMNFGKSGGGRIMSKKHARLMQAKVQDEEGYGLAIRSLEDLVPGQILKGHTGSAYGLYSAMFFHPRKKYGFVVITNGCNPVYIDGINAVLRKTMKALYEEMIVDNK